ncbi:MAG: type II secretion system F family protein [Patescibacteria group bacterium]
MRFAYEAKTQEGQSQKGAIDAGSVEAAVDILQQRRLIVIKVSATSETPFNLSLKDVIGRVSKKDIAIFSRQVATLFEAKVPIVESLKTLSEQEDKKKLRDVIDSLAYEVESGTPLSKALLKHPDVFSNFFIQVVRSGEASGKLGDVFKYLADYLERDVAVRQKIKGALIYPAFILVAMAVVMVILMTYVVPQISAILKDLGQTLPLITLVVVSISNFVASFWWLIAIIFGTLLIFGWRYIHTKDGKAVWDKLILDFPIIGNLLQKTYMMRFAETLSLLLEGGLPLPQSLEITSDMIDNEVYRAVLNDSVKAVREGSQMSTVLRQSAYVPKLVSQMVMVGENTGRIEDMLRHVSKFFASEVDSAISGLTATIEPILIVVIGAGVGVIVVSIIMPIYNIAGSF